MFKKLCYVEVMFKFLQRIEIYEIFIYHLPANPEEKINLHYKFVYSYYFMIHGDTIFHRQNVAKRS